MKIRMIFWIALTINAALSFGCAQKVAVVGGVEDMIILPKGTLIQGVSLPTDEPGKKYNIVTNRSGVWLSLKGWNRASKIEGSNPKEK